MRTRLHAKIKEMCSILKGEEHWVLLGSRTIWLPEVQQVVTTRRAAYAAFVGPIEEGQDVVPACGHRACISPYHASLVRGRKSRSLALPDQLAALATVRHVYDRGGASTLPEGLTPHLVNLVRYLLVQGNGVSMVAAATKLPHGEVVKVMNGAYDGAIKNLPRGSGIIKESKLEKFESPADLPGGPTVAAQSPEGVSIDPVPLEPEGMSGEEAEWLKTLNRG